MFPTAHVTDEQLRAIWSVCCDVSDEPTPRDACRRLSERLTAILGRPTPVFSREVPPWRLLASPGASDGLVQAASLAARELEYFPLAASTSHRVLKGHGNTGSSGVEGVLHGSVIGTYLHGPLLPKNAWFADWLIRRATGLEELEPLDDALEDAAHASARRAARV